MAPTTTRPHSILRILAVLFLSTYVKALGRFQARDDLAGPPGGHHDWPGHGHGGGYGDEDDNGHGKASCSCPLINATGSPSGFEAKLPVQTDTITVTVPGPTVTSPRSTITVQGTTITIPGSIASVTQPSPEIVTITVPEGPNITTPASSAFSDHGLNGSAPPVPTFCGPQTVFETVLATVTSTLA